MLEGLKVIPAYSRVYEALWGKKPKVIFVTDSQPLLGWLMTGWVQTDPQMQGVLGLVKERIDEQDSTVLWVGTSDQRADRHTKFIRSR